jgi:hypothetical protein
MSLNKQFRQNYITAGVTHIFTKWVTSSRLSPSFGGHGSLLYRTGTIVEEPNAKISDKQCDVGIHVFRRGYRPEWAGLCNPRHRYIALDVEVASEDICFAGLPGNDARLRVKRVKVLT